MLLLSRSLFFFFTDPATTEIYTLSLHDALPICRRAGRSPRRGCRGSTRRSRRRAGRGPGGSRPARRRDRSEEHTSELQSQSNLVCRLLLEKKKKKQHNKKKKIIHKHTLTLNTEK